MTKQPWPFLSKTWLKFILVVNFAFLPTISKSSVAQASSTSSQIAECSETKIKQSINLLKDAGTNAFDRLVVCKASAVPFLIQAINNDDKTVPVTAIAILSEIGLEATEAIPALTEGLKNQTKKI